MLRRHRAATLSTTINQNNNNNNIEDEEIEETESNRLFIDESHLENIRTVQCVICGKKPAEVK
jgi:hypothetical protein